MLVGASAGAAHLVFPLSLAIAALLAIVVLSYRQTVLVYESSGGAYIVAKENLGRLPSLVAAAALLTDYVLTVAVSVAAGVLALTSAVSSLRGHELTLSLACVRADRGREPARRARRRGSCSRSRRTRSSPRSSSLIVAGFGRCATSGCPNAVVAAPADAGVGAVTAFVVLRAFASGSTALTGVEAIANGVNAFRRPHGRNAAKTLAHPRHDRDRDVRRRLVARRAHARPSDRDRDAVGALGDRPRRLPGLVSALGFMYWAVQVLTLAVLVLAANTSYQGFPRLAALLARDRFFARQFTNLGDRLVFSNGIVVLDGASRARCSGSTTRASTR